MQFRIMFLWEFIQNLPLVAGLMLAIQWWQASLLASSITAMISGSLLGAVLIRLTERNIVDENQAGLVGNREPIAVTVTNVVLMFLIMLILTVYLTAEWSNPLTDLPVGGLIGFLLSAGQSKAAGRPVGGRHSLAFTAAFPIALITLRLLSAALPMLFSIFLITLIVSLIITYIDYGHLTSVEGGTN
jgi:hypothetical protein